MDRYHARLSRGGRDALMSGIILAVLALTALLAPWTTHGSIATWHHACAAIRFDAHYLPAWASACPGITDGFVGAWVAVVFGAVLAAAGLALRTRSHE